MDWTNLTELLFSMAALLAGVGYFRQGRTKSKLDTVNLFKDQVDALERKVNTQTEDIVKMTTEIHNLKTAIDEKDRKLAEALQILQGRDPGMQAFIAIMQEYIKTNTPLLEEIRAKTLPTIARLETYLNKQQF